MSSEADVLWHIEPHLLGKQPYQAITELNAFTKVLGIQWYSQCDVFCLAIGETPPITTLTKTALISDISKIYDVLGWFGPFAMIVGGQIGMGRSHASRDP